MKRKKYGREPGITLHRWVVKIIADCEGSMLKYCMTKADAREEARRWTKNKIKTEVQIFKAIHEFEEAWEK